MKIEAVVTCVEYGDFLAHTLPTNKALFDRLVVVTDSADSRTQRVCEFWHVECVVTKAFGRQAGEFRKGAGINAGLARLSMDGWVAHMDADLFLPPLMREILTQAQLDPAMIYGIDRFMVRSFDDWQRFLAYPALQHENSAFVHTANRFDIGTRVASPDYSGYVPIGFFQLWYPSASGVKSYPDSHTTAGRGDMLFTKQWPRAKRGFLPELIGYHLESCAPAQMGANWNGRRTPPFGPRIEIQDWSGKDSYEK